SLGAAIVALISLYVTIRLNIRHPAIMPLSQMQIDGRIAFDFRNASEVNISDCTIRVEILNESEVTYATHRRFLFVIARESRLNFRITEMNINATSKKIQVKFTGRYKRLMKTGRFNQTITYMLDPIGVGKFQINSTEEIRK